MSESRPLVKTLKVPPMEDGKPAAGKRVRQTAPEYEGTEVYHSLYLPTDWRKGARYPVIVEYTGNYFPASGSTGEVKDANLGYGLSAGEGYIWVVLPFVSTDGKENSKTWWGDEQATIRYCLDNLPRICESFGGDPSSVFICGFSRGAVAVNYIGLANDEIARLWLGFITYDHYDGVLEWKGTTWGAPLEKYQAAAEERLARLAGRATFVGENGNTAKTQKFLGEWTNRSPFTFLSVPIKNLFPDIPNEDIVHPHTDKWLLYPSPYADKARQWLASVYRQRPGFR